MVIPGATGGVTISNISQDIRCDKGDRIRLKFDVIDVNQVFLFYSIFIYFDKLNSVFVSGLSS